MRDIWWVRHGETEYNRSKRFQGHLDTKLSSDGLKQAALVAKRFGHMNLDFKGLYCSDLSRASITATHIGQEVKLHPSSDTRLREINVGALEGLLRSDCERVFPEYTQQLALDPWHTQRPQGESMAQVTARVMEFVHTLPSQGSFIVVAHGGVVRAALQGLLDFSPMSIQSLRIDNTSITRIHKGKAFCIGDTAHLE